MQTFSMMLGDNNYREAFLEPMLADKLPFPFLSFIILVIFSMLIPILLMNLLVRINYIKVQMLTALLGTCINLFYFIDFFVYRKYIAKDVEVAVAAVY